MKLSLKFWRLLWTRNSILAKENYDHISIKLAYYYISFTATATWIPCLNLSSIKRCGEETPGHCITAPHLLYFIIYICIILITILLFQLYNIIVHSNWLGFFLPPFPEEGWYKGEMFNYICKICPEPMVKPRHVVAVLRPFHQRSALATAAQQFCFVLPSTVLKSSKVGRGFASFSTTQE